MLFAITSGNRRLFAAYGGDNVTHTGSRAVLLVSTATQSNSRGTLQLAVATSCEIPGSDFTSNSAGCQGGAIKMNGLEKLLIKGTRFSGNAQLEFVDGVGGWYIFRLHEFASPGGC